MSGVRNQYGIEVDVGRVERRSSRAKIRNIMSALYSHAIRWEWTDKNQITQVRQSAKRSNIPTVLSVDEISTPLLLYQGPYRTAVILDSVNGLRGGNCWD